MSRPWEISLTVTKPNVKTMEIYLNVIKPNVKIMRNLLKGDYTKCQGLVAGSQRFTFRHFYWLLCVGLPFSLLLPKYHLICLSNLLIWKCSGMVLFYCLFFWTHHKVGLKGLNLVHFHQLCHSFFVTMVRDCVYHQWGQFGCIPHTLGHVPAFTACQLDHFWPFWELDCPMSYVICSIGCGW